MSVLPWSFSQYGRSITPIQLSSSPCYHTLKILIPKAQLYEFMISWAIITVVSVAITFIALFSTQGIQGTY